MRVVFDALLMVAAWDMGFVPLGMRVGHLPNHLLDATLIYWGSLPGGRWVSAGVSMSGTNSCGNRRLVYIVSVTFRFIGFHDFGARESHSFHRFALLDMHRNPEM